MTIDFLEARRKALEEVFFKRLDRQLLARLREKREAEQLREALRRASAIDDDALLDELVYCGVRAESLAALVLAPLVVVAWADGDLEPSERRAVLAAAADFGLEAGSPSQVLLEDWLGPRPDWHLLHAWTEYVRCLSGRLHERNCRTLRDEIMRRAREVAKAAGGMMGVGAKVSTREKEVLSDLERAFSPDAEARQATPG